MKGITYTQVVLHLFLSHGSCYLYFYQMTGNPVPQLGMGSSRNDTYLIDKLNGLSTDLGFSIQTVQKSMMSCNYTALMVGTAGLPHVIVRFFTVKRVKTQENQLIYWF
jgi:cation/acetate symporter